MAILTKEKILEEIKKKNIKIVPFDKNLVGPASVDLHLGNLFRKFIHCNKVFKITEEADCEKITQLIKIKKGKSLLMRPGETVLGVTQEKIKLSSSICALLEGRSRFARVGLGVHITSGFIQPGINNYQVLEITNLGPMSLALIPGTRICQIIFLRCDGEAIYKGKFKNQTKP